MKISLDLANPGKKSRAQGTLRSGLNPGKKEKSGAEFAVCLQKKLSNFQLQRHMSSKLGTYFRSVLISFNESMEISHFEIVK